MQIPRGYQKKQFIVQKVCDFVDKVEKNPILLPSLRPQKAQKANWRTPLHAQSSQMHSIPLGPSEKNSFCAKVQRKRDMCDPQGKNPILGHSQRLKKVFLSAQSVCARLRTGPIIMQIPRGYQKKQFIVQKVCDFVDKVEKTPILGPSLRPQKAQNANWRSPLHAQSSQMHSIPLGPSEKNSFCAKVQRKRDMCDPQGKNPILGHSQRLKKVFLSAQSVCARLRTGPIIMQIPRGYQKKQFIVQKVCDFVDKVEKTPILGPSLRPLKAQKANWRSPLHAQSSQMHSIPLGPSQKNSFCAKVQRKRDMCDPQGKNPILGHSQRLKKVFLSAQSVCARLRTGPIIMQIPRGYQKKQFIVQKVCDFVDKVKKNPILGPSLRPQKAQKANWRSPLHAKSSQMHSIPLGPSQKNSFCAKVQRKRDMCDPQGKNPILGHSQRLKKVFLSAQSVCARLRTGPIIMQIPRGYQKKQFIVQKVCDFVDKVEKTPILGPSLRPQKAQKGNWRSRLHAQSSQMHSIPLGPSEKNSFCAKVQRKRDMCDPQGKNPILGHSQRLKKVFLSAQSVCARLRTGPIIMQIPRGYQKKQFIVQKVCDFVDKVEKIPILGPSLRPQKAQKANWRSPLHAQSSQMHSIPLGPSEKNSFCAKVQRKRDMCDPQGKNPIFGHSQRLKKVFLSAQSVCARLRTGPIIMQIPRGYQKKQFIVQKVCDFVDKVEKTPILGPSLRPQKAQKANWRSPLHAQSSQMHSIPLGPSEKNSFCAKVQRKRDMCDPWGKNPILGHSQRLKKVFLSAQSVCARLRTGPIIMQIPWGYQKKTVYCVESLRFCR